MIRKAFLMSVKAGCEAEYKRRHDEIWPELVAVLKEHGVHHYGIYLHAGSGQLFACAEIEDEDQWQAISSTEVCRRWWNYMRDIMPTHVDGRPLATDLSEVFYLP